MDLGTGIYSSTVLVLLAISVWQITKHKKWKLFGKVCAGLGAVCALVVGVGYLWNYVSTRPKPLTEFEGVKLGASITDVTLTLGAPTNVFGNRITYDEKEIIADFESKKLQSLELLCSESPAKNVMGFDIYSRESDVIKKLGVPSRTSISSDGLFKLISYKKWNVAFGVRANSIHEICMSSSEMEFPDELLPGNIPKFDTKNSDLSTNAVSPDDSVNLEDPCAPDITKAERKRRLSRFGTIRQTADNSFSAGEHSIVFYSDGTLALCS